MAMATTSVKVDLMAVAEGVAGQPKTSLVREKTLDKGLLSMFEQTPEHDQPSPKRKGKAWTPPAKAVGPEQVGQQPRSPPKKSMNDRTFDSPQSVTALPDYTPVDASGQESPKSPRLSENPFMQQEAAKVRIRK
jgi:hypothetical protein